MIARYTREGMGEIWSDETKFATWKRVQVALVETLEARGVAERGATAQLSAQPIPTPAHVAELERTLDHDVIAFLTALVEGMGPARRWVHFGMTSTDLIDTAQALRVGESIALVSEGLDAVTTKTRDLALRYKHTPMVGRTHGVHAEVMTLGLKFLSWYAELERDRVRLARARETMRVGTISGAVGTCPHHAPDVEAEILGRLSLEPAPVATQVLGRDRHAELMTTLAIVGASVERFATEIRHLHRTEVREVSEGFAKGQKGSSAMPHKRNPITAERLAGLARVLRANALAALENVALWHERDITHSSVERIILPDSLILTDYVLDKLSALIDRLDVDESRLARNLRLTGGLVYSGNVLLALTQAFGNREQAYAIVQRHALACWNEGGTLAERLKQDPDVTRQVDAEAIDRCFDAREALRNVDAIFERTLS